MSALAWWPLYVALCTATRWVRGSRCGACGVRWFPAGHGWYCDRCWPSMRLGFARELAVEAARARLRASRGVTP